uniref:Invertebrate defensins family profile domain-containing protein n=1 Tax=Culicoides sonorensis TaxID=179676 RepID=Q5QBJ4_CULSO|nr:unknown [Culicoides sonorensis]
MKFLQIFVLIATLWIAIVTANPVDDQKTAEIQENSNLIDETNNDEVIIQPRLSCQALGPIGCAANCKRLGFRGGWCTTGNTCRCFR